MMPLHNVLKLSGHCTKSGQVLSMNVYREESVYVIDACWDQPGNNDCIPYQFRLRRTFTKSRYAAEWIELHMRLASVVSCKETR